MKQLSLSVVTPERSIVSQLDVEAVVLPGEAGQLTLLPGHINFLTSLRHGTFAYQVNGDWQVAFLSGGFTQVFDGKVTVLAETLEMAKELDLAQSELQLQEINSTLKTTKVGSSEFQVLAKQKSLVEAKIKAAKGKIH